MISRLRARLRGDDDGNAIIEFVYLAILLMVPVVFLVLPVTVLFALFPGFFGFSFSG